MSHLDSTWLRRTLNRVIQDAFATADQRSRHQHVLSDTSYSICASKNLRPIAPTSSRPQSARSRTKIHCFCQLLQPLHSIRYSRRRFQRAYLLSSTPVEQLRPDAATLLPLYDISNRSPTQPWSQHTGLASFLESPRQSTHASALIQRKSRFVLTATDLDLAIAAGCVLFLRLVSFRCQAASSSGVSKWFFTTLIWVLRLACHS